MNYECLEFQQDGGIATITFNRPKALNALNSATLRELDNALDCIAGDENIRVLILTGAGDKAFIAGADITEMRTLTPLGARKFAQLGQTIIDRLQRLPIPVIAAVNGYALGGGCEMALACDFIYAAETATFGLPEISLGIIPGFGGTQRLPRLIGANMARELIFTGKYLSAEKAREAGLVNTCLPADQLMAGVAEVARQIAKKGSASLRAAKDAIRQGLNCDLNSGLEIERDAFALCISSPDAKEGTSAFIEKRKAEFAGSRDI
ncbi:enoyl-CoA hydratase-related protein [Desulfosediminicola flagellatus]|uniref:enoyl-CoA hydratase-related protein n=1 Tax=Desulfosediminicola flagellatus TaxID=2569541 RepID=UPI0010ABF9E8|nr:enoyl-CoA hydratase-related protein [Desulfosediminicola flagellatus]